MSRGFVTEGDQEEVPFVPQRASLPPNTPNYVTPQGLKALEEERAQLLATRESHVGMTEADTRIFKNLCQAQLEQLEVRIRSAKVLDNSDAPKDVVRFGQVVSLRMGFHPTLQYLQVTGVDEANVKEGKLAFTSPLAKALLGKPVGYKGVLRLPAGDRFVEIVDIL